VSAARLPALDALKGLACLTVVGHHLALYGPMSDVVQPHAPGLIGWFHDYGRMAVQMFLVLAGFLAAATLAPDGTASFAQPGRLLVKRYKRLGWPYLVALGCSLAVAMAVRPWFAAHAWLPGEPGWLQLLAHGLLLQDVLGIEALSAGVWYVAIDMQLFALAILVFVIGQRSRGLTLALVLGLAAASLLLFNRQAGLDFTALYFFGSYAMGLLAFWVVREVQTGRDQAAAAMLSAMLVLIAAALLLDFRLRIALAAITALSMIALSLRPPDAGVVRGLQGIGLLSLGKMSYSIFLIHFPVLLLVNAIVSHFWSGQLLPNALGMATAFGLSLLAGAALWRLVESPKTPWRRAGLRRAAAA
jgi:peptidoglycan/LPS O-acetylase OafA/YrhL